MGDAIQRMSLDSFFRFKAPTHLIGTTYTVSLMFFESAVWPFVDKSALARCLVLCDRAGFRRAVCEAAALREVSLSYLAVPVPTRRTFHPKFWIATNDHQTSILIGSGNLTQSGFMDNNELFDVVTFEHGMHEEHLVSDIESFLLGLKGLFSSSDENGRWVKETVDQVRGLLPRSNASGANGSTRLLHSFTGPFHEQLKQFAPKDDISLYVASPYFGGTLDGLKLLHKALQPKRVVACPHVSQQGCVNLRVDELESIPEANLAKLKIGKDGVLSHFKLYGVVHPSEEGVLFNGSVNCTRPAIEAENIEAGLLRCMPAADVETYFASCESLEAPIYERIESPDAHSHCELLLSASRHGNELVIQAHDLEKSILPLRDVIMRVRRGGVLTSKAFSEFFNAPSRQEIVSLTDLGDVSSGSGAIFIEIAGVDILDRQIQAGNFVNDLESLSSTPAHRNAFNAALKLASTEAIPSIFEISAITAFLEEVALGNGGNEEPPAEGSGAKSGIPRQRPERAPLVPVWPPQAASRRDGNQFGDGNVSVTWFQRILALIFKAEAIAPEDEPEASDSTKTEPGPESAGGIKTNISELERLWERSFGLFRQFKTRMDAPGLPEHVLPRLIPGMVVAAWMLLGTRRRLLTSTSNATAYVETQFDSLKNLLSIILESVFRDRGQRPCLADALNEHGLELQSDFRRIFLVFFAYLYALAKKNPSKKFPIDLWLKFEACALEQMREQPFDSAEFKQLYEAYLFSPGALSWEVIERGLQSLLAENWQSVEGLQVLDYLRAYGADQIRKEPEYIVRAMDSESLTGMRIMAKRGEAFEFHPAGVHDCFCTAPGCGRVETPRFANLKLLLPVLCVRCRRVSVPTVLLALDKRRGQ